MERRFRRTHRLQLQGRRVSQAKKPAEVGEHEDCGDILLRNVELRQLQGISVLRTLFQQNHYYVFVMFDMDPSNSITC
jgi:hypothetical protein